MQRSFSLPEKILEREAKIEGDFLLGDEPIDLEIGCGVGLHPIRRALSHPERKLVAIEHTREKFEKFAGRLENHPPFANLLPVHANAISWVSKNIPRETLSEIFLLYPNPNLHKKNQRWFNMPFMAELVSKLKTGGQIHLATNIEFYFREAVERSRTFNLQIIEHRELGLSDLPTARTHFERKYLARGETCFTITFAKDVQKT